MDFENPTRMLTMTSWMLKRIQISSVAPTCLTMSPSAKSLIIMRCQNSRPKWNKHRCSWRCDRKPEAAQERKRNTEQFHADGVWAADRRLHMFVLTSQGLFSASVGVKTILNGLVARIHSPSLWNNQNTLQLYATAQSCHQNTAPSLFAIGKWKRCCWLKARKKRIIDCNCNKDTSLTCADQW